MRDDFWFSHLEMCNFSIQDLGKKLKSSEQAGFFTSLLSVQLQVNNLKCIYSSTELKCGMIHMPEHQQKTGVTQEI